ncbi:MAG: sulfur carrier protein ThiS adenylyltransferase ThiF, partial [Opitutae bacterium]|nr:sulfur carrier protein ThiS adenylyltransferase ThiF [Opitutae bacterium]
PYLSPEEREKLSRAVIGIAGAGGLGSNCAMHLARSGVRKLVIADFDRVAGGNLNRQFFFTDQVGRPKVEALGENLRRIVPGIELTLHDLAVDAENAMDLFGSCDIVVEAFDSGAAKQMLIRTMLEAGKPKEAAALLKAGKFRAADPEQWNRLELLNLLRSGEFEQFRTRWNALRKQGWKNPAPILYLLASDGARLAAAKKQPAAAEELWKDAFDLAGSDPERQTALRELINLQAESDPAQAAETVRRYLDFFPDAPDRTGLLMRGARLLARAGDGKQAVDLYSKITGDNRIPASSRLVAAREAAVAASDAGMFDIAETMFRYLIDQADTPARKQEGRLLLGEHFYRRGNYTEAAKLMQTVADDNGPNAEAARFWLLQSLIPLKRYADAAPVAEKLRDASDPQHRIAAEYFRAFLLEKRGQAAAARSEYERFLVLHPDSGFAPAAMLSAAELALALRDFTAAADGFFRYAALKPTPEDAPRALYLAMQSGCFGNRLEDIEKALKLLDET